MQISEFCAWLRTQTNKHKRPFQEQTIIGYAETARVLDRLMTVQGIDSDFTACDVAVLNSRCTQHAKLRMAGDDRIPFCQTPVRRRT